MSHSKASRPQIYRPYPSFVPGLLKSLAIAGGLITVALFIPPFRQILSLLLFLLLLGSSGGNLTNF